MGRRGPPKKPTQLKVVQNTPGGKHKLPKHEVRPKKVRGTSPPRHLIKPARKIWREQAAKLEELGLLTNIDLNALARYCDYLHRWIELSKMLDKEGYYIILYHEQSPEEQAAGDPPLVKYVQQRPEVNIFFNLGKDLARLESQFGLTPAARTGLDVTPKKSDGDAKSFLYGG